MFEWIISFQAAYRPDAVALSTSAGQATFAQLDTDIEKLAGALLPVARPGMHVSVAVTPVGLQWALLLALARLGCATSSLPRVGERPEADLLALLKPDLVIAEPGRATTAPKLMEITDQWLGEALSRPVVPTKIHRFAEDDPVRIVLSSGTTGAPKKMAFSRRVVDARIRTGGLSKLGHRRLHSVVGLDAETGFRAPLVAWASGMPALYPDAGFRWADFLLASRPEVLVVVPVQLNAILAALPETFPAQPQLSIVVVSGALPPALYERAGRLTKEIFVTYGSTEAGLACQLSPQLRSDDSASTGVVSPSAEVEVVDDDDAGVPFGVAGRIRVRSDEMVDGYLDNPELSRQAFKDGWFYPGDRGVLDARGRLTVLGRDSEVMDLGGMRLAPDAIENVLLRCPGVCDAAAFSAPNPSGLHEASAVVVASPGFDLTDASARLTAAMPHVRVMLRMAQAIPRTARGKIDRNALAGENAGRGPA